MTENQPEEQPGARGPLSAAHAILISWTLAAINAPFGAIRPHWLVIRLLPRVSPALAAGIAFGVLLGAAVSIATTFATGALVGAVPAAASSGPNAPATSAAFSALFLVAVLFVVGRVLHTVRVTLGTELGSRLDKHLRERVMRAMVRPTGIAHLEEPQMRDDVERAQGIVSGYTAGRMVNPLANMAAVWFQSAGSAAVLASFSAPLAAGLFVVWAIAGHHLRREYLRSSVVAHDGLTRHVRRANYLRDLVMTPGAGKELRLWGMLSWLTDRFTAERWRVIDPMDAERASGDRIHGAATVASQLATFTVLAALGLAASRGEIDLRSLAVYLGAAVGVTATANWTDARELAYGTRNVPAVLALERRTTEAHAAETVAGAASPTGLPRREIRLEGVTFWYPGAHAPALDGLDLVIPAGKSLAVVGQNGAGKTTLVKLIARLYDPRTPPGSPTPSGRITVDGTPLSSLDPRAWQRRVSAIFQDYVQYPLTARDNVAFGAIERAHDEDALLEAARRSGALEVIERLPRGWDTVLSRQFTDGADLSGGQWQRLALARALFAVSGGASVLVLDEPTANLDVRAEAALYDRFLDITRGLTTVLISHRFSTVRRADHIVVLEQGRVREQGTHEALMALRGRYAEMFTLQAARFQQSAVEDGAVRAGDWPWAEESSDD